MTPTTDIVGDVDFVLRLIDIAERRLQGGFWVVELPSRATLWSDGMFQLIEADRASFIPDFASINSHQHPGDRRSPSELETEFREASAYDREFRLITARGRLRWITCRVEFQLDAAGMPARMIGIMFDISEEHETKQMLAAHRERFNALTSVSPLLVWSARPDGHVESIAGWHRLTGQDSRAAEGSGWLGTVHPDDQESTLRKWRASIETGLPYHAEVRLQVPGGYRWISASAVPVRSPEGTIIEWIGSAVDIQSGKEWRMDPDDSIELTGAQIRAARGLLNWSVNRLSREAGVAGSAIRRLEEFDGVTKGEAPLRTALKACLTRAGIEFIFPPNGKAGVRPV